MLRAPRVAVAVLLGATATATGLPGQTRTPPTGLDLYMPDPPAAVAVALGRRLFFDRGLSRDSTLSCASCHRPDHSFANDRPLSVGVFGRQGRRNVPTLVNRGWGAAFFWDGRTETLEAQVLEPLRAPDEMSMTVDEVVERVGAVPLYREHFRRAFRTGVDQNGLARALAAYVRSIQAGDSPFDRAMEGDGDALDDTEKRGLELFQGRARCARCHTGALLTDEGFHNTGVAFRFGEPADSGRAHVTGRPEDVGAFKTPTLREVSRTAPYMHDGSLATLEEVVEFYDGGGHANPHLDERMLPLGLDRQEETALVAFLRALAGRVVEGRSLSEPSPSSRGLVGLSPSVPPPAGSAPAWGLWFCAQCSEESRNR